MAGTAAASPLFGRLLESELFGRARAALADEAPALALTGLVESGRALLLTLLQRELGRPLLLVVPDSRAASEYRRDLQAFAGLLGGEGARRRVLRFPSLDADPYRGVPPHFQVSCERVAALHALEDNEVDLLVAPVRALTVPLPAPEEFRRGERRIAPGTALDPEALALHALELGYRIVDTVTSPGELCRRGGILDVWPPHLERPRRVELYGDEVDSIRRFDPTTQRSLNVSGRFDIVPAQELPLTGERAARLLRALGAGEGETEEAGQGWGVRLAGLKEEGVLLGSEACASLVLDRSVTLFEHLPEGVAVLDEPLRVEEELQENLAERSAAYREAGEGLLPPPEKLFFSTADILERLRGAALRLSELLIDDRDESGAPGERLAISCRPNRMYAGRATELARDLAAHTEAGDRVLVFLQTRGSADRLGELLEGQGLAHRRIEPERPESANDAGATVDLLPGRLNRGVHLPDLRLLLLSEREIFGEQQPPPAPRRRRGGPFLSDFRDLKVGDHVVHVDHGIGRYEGLVRRGERELVALGYHRSERLLVPVDRIDLLQTYRGSGGRRPKLDRLGGTSFRRAKTRARKAAVDISKQLLELYARRKAQSGVAFSPDTPWQREFEEAFPHELTPDQRRAISDVKSGMESPQPMDRLLCGDVGFGKTEVAVRAAFKAIQDGYQVAVLVPTTVLAFQHMNTFRARFAAFPVEVDMVSRFRSRGELSEVLARVAAGRVDILVGTHRLLSKDLRFRRLGLLVIDEEQRFGVRHKERLREIATGVDTLLLSATPIPRTLQMSLGGVRDISIIETPPRNRLAIQTHVMPYRPGVVSAAIRNEMRRGGQVFVVHNRVESIPAMAAHLRELVPEARIAVAHGQMSEGALEKAMISFVRGDAEVLVSTTIIENGLDIPRANTLLVNRADHYGLAQLYQMRGRIGRSDVQAYAYLLVPSRRTLTPLARRRLLALQEFSELGSGFRVAAMDLEIRGAGELLGARQHGHVAAVGFDLYVKMLERAVRELREGVTLPEETGITINLGVAHRLPESYVPEPGLRLQLYHRLSVAETREELEGLRAELRDRFGEPPPPARALFRLAELRLQALSLGVQAVEWSRGTVILRFGPSPKVDPERIIELVRTDSTVSMTPQGAVHLRTPDPKADRIAAASMALRRLA